MSRTSKVTRTACGRRRTWPAVGVVSAAVAVAFAAAVAAAADSFVGGGAWTGVHQAGYPLGIGRTLNDAGTTEAVYGWSYLAPLAVPSSGVVSRLVFYNRSAFDGGRAAADAGDDGAIATDKVALRPGQTAGFQNYTSYARGLNGVMVDIADAPGLPALTDFEFRVGNDDAPAGWVLAPAPVTVAVRSGAGVGGATRVTFIWEDRAIAGRWLQVRVLPTAATGLVVPDVFYFGNAIGETGNQPGINAIVDGSDETLTRQNVRSLFRPAPIDFAYDFNRDRQVDATDQILARANATDSGSALRLITPSAGGPALASGSGQGGGEGRLEASGKGVTSWHVEARTETPASAADRPSGLVLARRADGRLHLQWPGRGVDGWRLEVSSGDGRWVPVTEGAARMADGWLMDPVATGGARFFRGVPHGASERR